MRGDPIFRPYRPGDEAALAALFSRVFGRAMTSETWLWKLRPGFVPLANVWVGEAEGTIVFQTAGIPFRLRIMGEEHDAVVAVDAMTAPEWRRRGVLTAGARAAYDAWREAGMAFVIGLPNERWGSRSAALGWTKLFPIERLVRPLRPERTAARQLGLPFVAKLAPLGTAVHHALGWRLASRSMPVRDADPSDPAVDFLDAALAGRCPVVPRHDGAWARWRLRPPGDPYRMLVLEDAGAPRGWAAFRRSGDDIHLAELRSLPEHLPAVLRTLLEKWREEGIEKATTFATPGAPLHRHLLRAGFLRTRHSFSCEIVPLRAGLPLDTLRSPESWCLSGADFDVV